MDGEASSVKQGCKERCDTKCQFPYRFPVVPLKI